MNDIDDKISRIERQIEGISREKQSKRLRVDTKEPLEGFTGERRIVSIKKKMNNSNVQLDYHFVNIGGEWQKQILGTDVEYNEDESVYRHTILINGKKYYINLMEA
ncbi:MAG: hypothetical protein H8D45_24260 [Bacteroidetes bacterium]|nr:hypothetical protein [Bacteroidota bacterium]